MLTASTVLVISIRTTSETFNDTHSIQQIGRRSAISSHAHHHHEYMPNPFHPFHHPICITSCTSTSYMGPLSRQGMC